MKSWAVLGISLLASAACAADKPPLPFLVPKEVAPVPVPDPPLQAATPEVTLERKRILDEKTAELHKLQDEIQKLGGSISSRKKVRMTLRVVEVDVAKLKALKLSDPFQPAPVAAGVPASGPTRFESDKALLQTLEPLVSSGCATIVFNPTVITSLGETAVVNCFREIPWTEEAEALNKQPFQAGSRQFPGLGLSARTTENPEGDLTVEFACHLTEENPANSVTLNGKTQMGTSSRRVQTTCHAKSGVPLSMGGLLSRWRADGNQAALGPAGPNSDGGAAADQLTIHYTFITTELLPDIAVETGPQRLSPVPVR